MLRKALRLCLNRPNHTKLLPEGVHACSMAQRRRSSGFRVPSQKPASVCNTAEWVAKQGRCEGSRNPYPPCTCEIFAAVELEAAHQQQALRVVAHVAHDAVSGSLAIRSIVAFDGE